MTWGPYVGYVVVGLVASGVVVIRLPDFRDSTPAGTGFAWLALGLLWPVFALVALLYFLFSALGHILLWAAGRG